MFRSADCKHFLCSFEARIKICRLILGVVVIVDSFFKESEVVLILVAWVLFWKLEHRVIFVLDGEIQTTWKRHRSKLRTSLTQNLPSLLVLRRLNQIGLLSKVLIAQISTNLVFYYDRPRFSVFNSELTLRGVDRWIISKAFAHADRMSVSARYKSSVVILSCSWCQALGIHRLIELNPLKCSQHEWLHVVLIILNLHRLVRDCIVVIGIISSVL